MLRIFLVKILFIYLFIIVIIIIINFHADQRRHTISSEIEKKSN